jgi:hypothetical protein
MHENQLTVDNRQLTIPEFKNGMRSTNIRILNNMLKWKTVKIKNESITEFHHS